MTTRRNLICLAVLAGLCCATSASAAIIVSIVPSDPEVAIGESVTLDILANIDQPVMAWGLDLVLADPTLAACTQTVVGPEWDATNTLDGDGLAGLTFPMGITGEVLLATVTLQGLAEGTTTVGLTCGADEDEGILLESGTLATGVQFPPATLTVVVPEPATFAMLLVPALLACARRR